MDVTPYLTEEYGFKKLNYASEFFLLLVLSAPPRKLHATNLEVYYLIIGQLAIPCNSRNLEHVRI